ncbi:MAG: hypothetical protein LBQ68_09895 [Clostridiales bacterium]|nr:hypothetical protein [Clostridiales bacterium]
MTVSDTAKKMMCLVGVHYIFALSLGLGILQLLSAKFQIETPSAFACGLTLGAALSAAKIMLLQQSIARSLGSVEQTSAAAMGFLIRNALTAGLLILAVFVPLIGVWGTALGLVLLQTSAFGIKLRGD